MNWYQSNVSIVSWCLLIAFLAWLLIGNQAEPERAAVLPVPEDGKVTAFRQEESGARRRVS